MRPVGVIPEHGVGKTFPSMVGAMTLFMPRLKFVHQASCQKSWTECVAPGL